MKAQNSAKNFKYIILFNALSPEKLYGIISPHFNTWWKLSNLPKTTGQ